MKKLLIILVLFLCLSWGICQNSQESVPNNSKMNANSVSVGTTVQEFVHGVDDDYYSLVMPAEGGRIGILNKYYEALGFFLAKPAFPSFS